MTDVGRQAGTGILFVISAPSGAGKSSLARRVIERVRGLEFSVSYTTRPRRRGERDGVAYHFVDDARFDAMVEANAFVEWAPIFGHRYGTGREATERALGEGRNLLLDIDVQGARQVRSSGLGAVFIFVLPPDYATLKARLEERRSESDREVSRRLSLAREETLEYRRYDYLVVNEDLERAAGEMQAIVEAERRRASRCSAEAETILSTFPPSRRE